MGRLRQLLCLVPAGCPPSLLHVLFVAELSHGCIQDPRVPVSPGLWVLQPALQPPAQHVPLGGMCGVTHECDRPQRCFLGCSGGAPHVTKP